MAERFLSFGREIFKLPGVSKFVGAYGLEFGAGQGAEQADLVPGLTVIGPGLDIAQNERALVVVAGELKEFQQVDSVNDGGLDVGAGKGQETGKEPVQ